MFTCCKRLPAGVYRDVVIVFDIIGTLLDLHALQPQIRRIFGSKLTLREFFKDVASYAMATSLAGGYRPFEDVACDVLRMNADAYGAEVTDKGIERFRKRFRSLPPFPEVKRSLQRLQDAGLRLAALSNSSEAALNQQLKRAGLDQFFQHVVSVDRVQRFKPAREVYLEAVEEFANQPHELVMVAAHPWDLFGAGQAGYRTALIEREKVAPFPGGPEPHYRTADLSEFVNKLLGQEDEHSLVSGWLLAGCGVALGVAGTLIAATANPRTAQPIGAHALP